MLGYITNFRGKVSALPLSIKVGAGLFWAFFSFGILYDTYLYKREELWIGIIFCLIFGWLIGTVASLFEYDGVRLFGYSDSAKQSRDAKLGQIFLRILLLVGNIVVIGMVWKQLNEGGL